MIHFFYACFLSAYYKETLLNDIRKAREKYQGEELAKELARIKLRMDNTEVLTSDIVINLLLSYRDIQVCYFFIKENYFNFFLFLSVVGFGYFGI